MANYSAINPFPIFLDQRGNGLNGGRVYFGEPGKDPETFPVPVYWDEAGAIEAAQPIRTIGGYISRFGTPSEIFAASEYSIRVRDRFGAQIFYADHVNGQLVDFIEGLSSYSGAGKVGFSHDNTYPQGTAGRHMLGWRNIKDAPYGAIADNITNDSPAIQSAVSDGIAYAPEGVYRMDSSPVGDLSLIGVGASFTGAGSLDNDYPAFGAGVYKAIAKGARNSIIGIAHNTRTSDVLSFPCGITGYGRMDHPGAAVFGIYAEARTYATAGCPTNEIDTFNHGGPPSGNLPPDRSFGTAQQVPVGATIAADGDYDSAIGIHVCRGGQQPRQWLTGIYIGEDSCVNYGIFIDAIAISRHTSAVIKHSVNRVGLHLQGVGTPIDGGAAFEYFDGAGVERYALKQDGSMSFTSKITPSAVGVTGEAAVLPARPWGYMKVTIDGFPKLLPLYNAPA